MHTRIALAAVGAALVTVIAMATPALAQTSGSLDTSFGSNGLVALPSGVGSPAQILVQSSGLIDVIDSETDPTTGNDDMAVVQYKANGTLNTSFGNDGVALASFPGQTIIGLSGVAESTGNIVVAGQGSPVATVTPSGTTGGGPGEEAVAEFTSSGTLDSSFGTGGEVITQDPSPVGEGDDQGGPVIVQTNGDIVTGGGVRSTGCSPKHNPDCTTDDVLTRYLPDGSLDTSFGDGGFAEVDDTSFATIGLGEDASGNIYALEGNNTTGPTPLEFSPSGAEESATTSTPPSLIAADNLLANGTYALGASDKLGTTTFSATDAEVVVHSLPSGAVDANVTSTPFDYANESGSGVNSVGATALAPDGDIVAAGVRCPGTTKDACSATDLIGLAALTPTGTLDAAFGNGGVTTIADGSTVDALAVQPNGDILVAFLTSEGTMLARVLGS
jgi:uncharacterized delta-60 repeat protein